MYLSETMLFSFILNKSNWHTFFLQGLVNFPSLIRWHNLQHVEYIHETEFCILFKVDLVIYKQVDNYIPESFKY